MRVFLDLEDTVISNWFEGFPVHTEQVRHFLHVKAGVTEVDIFSFAIWDERHVDEFNARLCADLEHQLGVRVNNVVDCATMMQSDQRFTRVRFENLMEFISLRGKADAFLNWAFANHPGEHCVLVDDIVPNRLTHDFDTGTRVQTINVFALDLTNW